MPTNHLVPKPLPKPLPKPELEPYLLWPPKLPPPFWKLVKECTPRFLVVTDGSLSFGSTSGFGLSQFVETLKATPVHGMLPVVVTAHRGSDPSADVDSFQFDSTVTKSKYDAIFLFGIDSAALGDPGTGGNLPQAEVDVLATFMEAGGGLFATGDHESLGAAMCGNLPRVRAMRHWYFPPAPSGSSDERITTNSPGDDGVFEFDDQSDDLPQKIYPRYFTKPWMSGSAPHALLQAPPVSGPKGGYEPIEVAPDHPHEGECVEPASLAGSFKLGGVVHAEWPAIPGSKSVPAPQVVAYGMTYGGAFDFKSAILAPRAFGVVAAWDGHKSDVGRVAVDSTWHHFVNINIDGTGSGRSGLQEPDPASPGDLRDTHALELIRRYWGNLANWLMPENVRKCLIFHKLIWIVDTPWFLEELASWTPDAPRRKDPLQLAGLGAAVASTLAFGSTTADVEGALDDLAELVLGKPALQAWSALRPEDGAAGLEQAAAREVRAAAVAGAALAIHDLRAPGRDLADSIEARGGTHAAMELAIAPARAAAARALGVLRKRAKRFEGALSQLEDAVK